MSKTAILVDGGFYRKRAKKLWGQHTPQETADFIHLLEKERSYVAVSNCIRESLNELANSKESIVKI